MAGSFISGSGNGSGRRAATSRCREINVTPLVDVMLVLLVVFMVTAPLLTVGVPVDLPQTQAPPITEPKEPLVITINAEGKIFLQETDGRRRRSWCRGCRRSPTTIPTPSIYVRGDRAINYGRVLEVMGLVSAAGFTKVSLIAEQPTRDKAETPASSAMLGAMRRRRLVFSRVLHVAVAGAGAMRLACRHLLFEPQPLEEHADRRRARQHRRRRRARPQSTMTPPEARRRSPRPHERRAASPSRRSRAAEADAATARRRRHPPPPPPPPATEPPQPPEPKPEPPKPEPKPAATAAAEPKPSRRRSRRSRRRRSRRRRSRAPPSRQKKQDERRSTRC